MFGSLGREDQLLLAQTQDTCCALPQTKKEGPSPDEKLGQELGLTRTGTLASAPVSSNVPTRAKEAQPGPQTWSIASSHYEADPVTL